MSTPAIPAELLRTLLPRELAVTERLFAGETIEAIAASFDVEPGTIEQIKADTQAKIEAWIKSDIRNVIPFIKFKPDGTLRTRAERIAMFEEGIALAEAKGLPRGNGYTAEQFDAVMFSDAAPNPKDVN